MTKVIKSLAEHVAALARAERLVVLDPEPGTAEGDELEVLTVLIKDYESRQFPAHVPDPIEAIEFRMEQAGLSQRDLVPFIGSRARVSEVLSRKRPLTLTMLRALHTGLGIPAAVLLRAEKRAAVEGGDEELARFPLREMSRRGWLSVGPRASEAERRDALRRFLAPLRETNSPLQVLTRATQRVRSDRPMDRHALMAWTARVMHLARGVTPRGRYQADHLTSDVLRGLVHLSALDDGPVKARDYLSRYGMTLIVLPHLPRTRLDGAAFFLGPDRPVVALTLRYDRVDCFWFTLLHEIGHILRDFGGDTAGYFDDLDSTGGNDPRESVADAFARDTLVPPDAWSRRSLPGGASAAAIRDMAARLGIHPAIIAGRVRHERNSYRILTKLVGHGFVREQFPEEN